jgi:hypothetical protein
LLRVVLYAMVLGASRLAQAQILRSAVRGIDVDARDMPLNLTPFTWREMNFSVRLSDIAVKAQGQPERELDALPPRPPDAPTGSEFLARTAALTKPERESAILDELRRGNVPSFLRKLKPIRLASRFGNGERHEGIVWVMPDYLAIGSDEDFVRIPMSLPVAEKLACELGYVLPTRKLVDAVYEQADVKLVPRPLPYGPAMETNEFYARSQGIIEEQLARRRAKRGALVAGHKKDLVVALRLFASRERLMIYGWHMPDSNPIQPLSDAHLAAYADYSHGVRLVARQALLDGRPVDFAEAVALSTLAPPFTYVPIPWFADRFRMPPR